MSVFQKLKCMAPYLAPKNNVRALSMMNSQYRYFSMTQQPRKRGKRERGKSNKFTNSDNKNEEKDIWSWIGDNAYNWGIGGLWFQVKLVGGVIFAAQVYTVYEYLRFGKIRWIKRVLWWLPNYLPEFMMTKLKDLSDKIEQRQSDKIEEQQSDNIE